MASSFAFTAIGTHWKIDIQDNISEIDIALLSEKIKSRIENFEKTYSRFRDDSLVSKISREVGEFVFPDDAAGLFDLYKRFYEATDGFVTPLMGKVLSDAGYDSKYSLVAKDEVKGAEKWDESFEYNHPTLKNFKPIHLDFGAIGKGYLVDIITEIIENAGCKNFSVDAGGDIASRNTGQALEVGLENPDNVKQVIGVAKILNKSICGSSGNRRAWGRHTHIINPVSAESPTNIIAVWAVAENTAIADGLTTALFFQEPEKLRKYFNFEYSIVYANRSIKYSPEFPGHFFSI